ncbi:hypothetical protein [Arsenicicoccus dermatophilus]|uniref:hypothetical protein n=1 Tax=Arsenicicoccus dermatophilus TaxID=1076331 RepID=UPI001F4C910A|nr:hypothetical protein [Arsenicicoccus dermatophilus]MCH8613986.1 hypothetical protein [Arsenicicoccus dermatophilus]
MVAPKKLGASLAAVTAASALALAGCSGATRTTATTTTFPPGAAGQAARVNDAGISPKDLVVPPVLKPQGLEGARKDFTLDGNCDTKLGEQKVTGTLKSSAKGPKDYVITINWVHGSDVMGRASKLLENVAPGSTQKVELTTKLTKAADGCTVNVTRGAKG